MDLEIPGPFFSHLDLLEKGGSSVLFYFCCHQTHFSLIFYSSDGSFGCFLSYQRRGPLLVMGRGIIYYPVEVSSMKYCCLGVFRKEYFRFVTK